MSEQSIPPLVDISELLQDTEAREARELGCVGHHTSFGMGIYTFLTSNYRRWVGDQIVVVLCCGHVYDTVYEALVTRGLGGQCMVNSTVWPYCGSVLMTRFTQEELDAGPSFDLSYMVPRGSIDTP